MCGVGQSDGGSDGEWTQRVGGRERQRARACSGHVRGGQRGRREAERVRERRREPHVALGVLVVLEQREQHARRGEARAVHRVAVGECRVGRPPVAHAEPFRLIVEAVGGARHLRQYK